MSHSLLDEILDILQKIKDDKLLLEKVYNFLGFEILPEIEKEEEEEIKIPEKYERAVKDIAGILQVGYLRSTSYLNLDTLEIEDLPEGYEYGDWFGEKDKDGTPIPLHTKWKNYLTFEPLSSRESFQIMADFAEQLDNIKVANTLIDILNQRKPFAHFNSFIHNSSYLQDWYDFKNKAYEKYVKEILLFRLKESE